MLKNRQRMITLNMMNPCNKTAQQRHIIDHNFPHELITVVVLVLFLMIQVTIRVSLERFYVGSL